MGPTKIENLYIEFLIDLEGKVLEIISGKFAINDFSVGESIYEVCPFLIGTIEALPLKKSLLIEGMFINYEDKEYNVDLDLYRNDTEINVLLHDRTNVYKFVNYLNQGRNDLYFLKRELASKNKELVKLRQIADQANEQKSRFLAMMSHEVRNPLNVILGYTELINKEETSLMVQEYLKYLTISGRNLKVIVDDILDLSRVEAGKLQLAKDPVHIPDLIEQIENNYKSSHNDLDIKLVFEVSDDIPEFVLGDDVRLIQIVTNLINNSIKFTPRGSVTTVVKVNSYNKKEATISFSVKDTGRGMTEEQASKMFEEYQQNRLSDNRLHKGVGLGLSIVKRLVLEMGGKITVDSFVNYGTTVIVEIPFIIHKENDEDDIENSENSGYKSIEGKKVLVADDNFLNLTIVSHILTKEKTDFTLVKDGVEALNALEKTKFDIVLLDINMPNLTGEELIKRKKELNQDNSKTPFLALTGNNSKDDIEGYKNIGFEDVIPKPFTAVQFVETIKKYL